MPLWTTRPINPEGVRGALQAALAGSSRAALNRAAVSLVDGALRIVAGGTDPNARLDITEVGAGTVAGLLGLTAAAVDNVSRYALGIGAASQAQAGAVPGDDGIAPTPNQIRGSRAAKSGIFALEDVDLFNILCLPNVVDVAVLSDAIAYATERRAFVLLDFPAAVDTVAEARQWLDSNGTIRDKNVAIYFPRVQLRRPAGGNGSARSRPVGSSPVSTLGPTLRGASGRPRQAPRPNSRRPAPGLHPDRSGERGAQPAGINCLRNFPVYRRASGARGPCTGRTRWPRSGSTSRSGRLALYLEESLYRGTKWVSVSIWRSPARARRPGRSTTPWRIRPPRSTAARRHGPSTSLQVFTRSRSRVRG